MEAATHEVAAKAYDELRMLLRIRRFNYRSALVKLYKVHVLSAIEFLHSCGMVHHAPPLFLGALDRVQECFLNSLD